VERDVTLAAIADRVRTARAAREALRIVGGGHWMHAGRPVAATSTLSVASLSGVVEYEPGDLTLTVRAATTLAEIERVTGAEGQWLPLDPFGSAEGTIGATISTGSAGPLATAFGTPRDQMLGGVFVSGTGDVVHAGGRVVKNVAGFDLVRLVTGSWGTLGVLAEVTLRLRALPIVDRTLAIECSADAAWRWLRSSEYSPMAAELLSPSLASTLGVGDVTTLLLRIGGNEAYVRATVDAAAALGPSRELDRLVWSRLAHSEPPAAAVVRLSTRPSRVAALWERTSAVLVRVGGVAHASPSRGVVRCCIPYDGSGGEEEIARLRGIVNALRIEATLVAESLPPALWSSVVPSAVGDPLSAGVRRAFDPDHILNPGILGTPA
jgi:glycolate oxidase FAD binding subunit